MPYIQLPVPSSGGIVLDLPLVGGFFSRGFFSALALLLEIFLAVLVVIWVAIIIYAAVRISASFGDPQKIETGVKYIKSVFWGVTVFLGFFGVMGVVLYFLGVGYPWEWSENLAQCRADGYAGGRFYFQGTLIEDPPGSGEGYYYSVVDQLDDFNFGATNSEVNVFCCEREIDDGYTEKFIEVGVTAPLATCTDNNTVREICVSSGDSCSPGGTPCCSGVCDPNPGPIGTCN